MHATKTPILLYSMSPVDTQRNDPLSCNRRNPRKKTTIYIYRIKCPAYISNNVTTTQSSWCFKFHLFENQTSIRIEEIAILENKLGNNYFQCNLFNLIRIALC